MDYFERKLQYLQERRAEVRRVLTELGVSEEILDRKAAGSKFQLKAASMKDMKVACIMDGFTLGCYTPECNLLELTPDNWKAEIEGFQPDLLFVESAWQGKDGLWYRKVVNGSETLYALTDYCHQMEIPVVFWNKEDPVHTDRFMPAAKLADYVFTTEIDCVKKYKTILGHDRVYHLHFAAQPKTHNPVEKYDRKDKFCFAGSYYHNFPKRAETFDRFAEIFIATRGFDIYDRNFGNARPEHAFPERYDPLILGKLEGDEIDKAYKGYYFGINMNSVDQSQTMFARRVFEMLASNTVTVGNYARGVKNLFGDLTICTNDPKALATALESYCSDETTLRKYRLLGLRRVLEQHLYEDRLSYICEKVFGKAMKRQLPPVALLAKADSDEERDRILASYRRQTYVPKSLYLCCPMELHKDREAGVTFVTLEELQSLRWESLPEAAWVGVLSPEHYYGENYLKDLLLTLRYGNDRGVGKAAFYKVAEQGEACLQNREAAYRSAEALQCDRAVFSAACAAEHAASVSDLLQLKDITAEGLFAADEFQFCAGWKESTCPAVDDLQLADTGLSMAEIEAAADKIRADVQEEDGEIVSGKAFWTDTDPDIVGELTGRADGQKLALHSDLRESENTYVNGKTLYDIRKYQKDGKLNIVFDGRGTLDFTGVILFFNAKSKKISASFTPAGRLWSGEIPEGAKYYKIALRLKGAGDYLLEAIRLGVSEWKPSTGCFLSRSNVLVLSNNYPKPEDLYRNMFVHQRMLAYKEDGCVYDVMRMNGRCQFGYEEFEGINVVEGRGENLEDLLETGRIDTVCIHFLDRDMWNVLKRFLGRIRINIWLHGAEIQPWWRREYNYTNAEELEKAKVVSAERQRFWAEVFRATEHENVHFVIVSEYFAQEIMEDNNIVLSKDRYTIVHNMVDTDHFSYVPKAPEQRLKLLSVRPYASRKYANDLTAETVKLLMEKPFFNELEFRLVGKGPLFHEILDPLQGIPNVIIEENFLNHDEIAALHKEYGIFLTPTRMDSQGVSRDEAMSSGLVPVTTAVTAIPEFCDETCAILAPGEDAKTMAEGIERLYNDPELFMQMSANAAARVRRQVSRAQTIGRELALINGSK